jgi:hypothetical protein
MLLQKEDSKESDAEWRALACSLFPAATCL